MLSSGFLFNPGLQTQAVLHPARNMLTGEVLYWYYNPAEAPPGYFIPAENLPLHLQPTPVKAVAMHQVPPPAELLLRREDGAEPGNPSVKGGHKMVSVVEERAVVSKKVVEEAVQQSRSSGKTVRTDSTGPNKRLKQQKKTVEEKKKAEDPVVNKASRFVGVTRNRDKWKAHAWFGGKTRHIGTYDTEIEAARARDDFVKKNRCHNAQLNFKD